VIVASPAQVSAILDAVARIRPELTAFFGCLYYAALRPEEAVALRHADCHLPSIGWGMLRLAAAAPRTAAAWTSNGTAPDGRLFRGTRGGPLSESVYGRAWHAARTLALGPELAATGLARRPYDLRHAALSLWLSAGGDPAQIAARAGNSVSVLLIVYSHCIHGRDDLLNRQIDHVLKPFSGPGPCPSVEEPAVCTDRTTARKPASVSA
jgi:integrase